MYNLYYAQRRRAVKTDGEGLRGSSLTRYGRYSVVVKQYGTKKDKKGYRIYRRY